MKMSLTSTCEIQSSWKVSMYYMYVVISAVYTRMRIAIETNSVLATPECGQSAKSAKNECAVWLR
eukprot:COSAG01_NODE_30598_length_613_cov_0.850195_1_plen_65_part_00